MISQHRSGDGLVLSSNKPINWANVDPDDHITSIGHSELNWCTCFPALHASSWPIAIHGVNMPAL